MQTQLQTGHQETKGTGMGTVAPTTINNQSVKYGETRLACSEDRSTTDLRGQQIKNL